MERREEEDLYATVILTPHFEESAEEDVSLEDDDSSSIYQAQDSSSDETSKDADVIILGNEEINNAVLSNCMDYVRGEIYVEHICHKDVSLKDLRDIYKDVFSDEELLNIKSTVWSSNSGLTPELFKIRNNAIYCKRNAMKEFHLTPQSMRYLAENACKYGYWF